MWWERLSGRFLKGELIFTEQDDFGAYVTTTREEQRDGIAHVTDADALDLLKGLTIGRQEDCGLAKGVERVKLELHL